MKYTHQPSLFQPEDLITPKWYFFKNSPLGQIYDSIPWEALSECLPKKDQGPGAPAWFNAKGMFGLMFLKAWLNTSDEKLIERFNTDWSLQLFCGKLLKEGVQIRDKAILSRIRTYIAENTDWQEVQRILMEHWKRDMDNTHVLMMDATCYESYLRYPTDVKLLWESCQWIYEKQLYPWCKRLNLRRPRSKYQDQKRKQLAYDRSRKKPFKAGQKRRKALIYLLAKGIDQLEALQGQQGTSLLNEGERSYLRTIKQVLTQQQYLQAHPGSKLAERIVSLPKPYVRPIVRGKENKRVEFGMKAHLLQVDGICFVDQMSFKGFNEAKRLKISTLKHRQHFGALHQLGADRIYATNENRRYCTFHQIFTTFPKKGPKPHDKPAQQLKKLLSNQRATVMEGSFGTHKTAYGIGKIKVKGQKREKLHVFFAIMSANAVKIGKRKALKKAGQPPPAQAA